MSDKHQTSSRQTNAFLAALTDRIICGGMITREEAEGITRLHTHEEIVLLICHATILRNHWKGDCIELCSIVNAKSGRCTEDCLFCAQSGHYRTEINTYPLLDSAAVLERARHAERSGAIRFGIVTSGKGISGGGELESLCTSVKSLREVTGLTPCASLGVVSEEQLLSLRDAGLRRYHHNLETAESYFSSVCSTHAYEDRVRTIRAAQRAGLEVCAGGIFGLGETAQQRIELAFALREINVDAVPINFLNPVKGTPLEHTGLLPPLEILQTIALFRFILPQKDIMVCGGREVGLRTLQPLMYMAGANGTMVGNYLTTSGRGPDIDLQEIQDLGLAPSPGYGGHLPH